MYAHGNYVLVVTAVGDSHESSGSTSIRLMRANRKGAIQLLSVTNPWLLTPSSPPYSERRAVGASPRMSKIHGDAML